jgi:nitronate monooxygenase
MGACGALLLEPEAMLDWAKEFRKCSDGSFQINLWIPDPAPERDVTHEDAVRSFLNNWGPEVPTTASEAVPPNFKSQCEAMLLANPAVISSIMGLYPPEFVSKMKAVGIKWFANATTVAEAHVAESAGADVIVVQGMESGGHRGAFDAATAESQMVGLFSLLPAVVDAVSVPVVATGGIADARGIAAALTLGASAVQIGTGFLRCPEARIPPAWANAIGNCLPEQTVITRAFSGRPGRSIATAYALAAARKDAPEPAPYPLQRGLTKAMRDLGARTDDIDRIQAWAGQSSGLAKAEPAEALTRSLWNEAQALLP